jgi:hypothetical protein
MMKTKWIARLACIIILWVVFAAPIGFSEDSDMNRATLAGLYAVKVAVEDVQPNIQPYAGKHGLTAKQIQSDIEKKLAGSGIKIVSGDAWMTVPGRPIFYVNVNTHETEKYWYAYNIKVELRQLVFLESRPAIKTLATTWSLNITGIANIGNLNLIKNDLTVITQRFLTAYRTVNKK